MHKCIHVSMCLYMYVCEYNVCLFVCMHVYIYVRPMY